MILFLVLFAVISIAFIVSRKMGAKEVIIILVLHIGLSLAAYVKYVDYKEVRNEYIRYAYEQYALDSFLGDSVLSWPNKIDPEAEKLEDRQDNLWLQFLGVTMLDIILLLYVGTTYKSKY